MGHDRDMTVRWGLAGLGPVADTVMRDLAHVPGAVLTDTVAVQDVLGEIAGQLGIRVIEGPAELP